MENTEEKIRLLDRCTAAEKQNDCLVRRIDQLVHQLAGDTPVIRVISPTNSYSGSSRPSLPRCASNPFMTSSRTDENYSHGSANPFSWTDNGLLNIKYNIVFAIIRMHKASK